MINLLDAANRKRRKNAKRYTLDELDLSVHGDRIYFLNVGGADAILLESDGKFAMVDAAEDSDNPRGFRELNYRGSEKYVLNCVKKIAGDKNGKVTLEFAVGTHAHSDHLGGFDTLFLDPDITVKKVLLKKYDERRICDFEVMHWDNKEVYEQMLAACEQRKFPVIFNLPTEGFPLGNFTVTLFNTAVRDYGKRVWENENSLGVLLEKAGLRAFLAGDINNVEGDEALLAPQIGKVDLLKTGHHGSLGSTSLPFAKTLCPDIAVVTNSMKNLKKEPMYALNSVNAAVYATTQCRGLAAEFTPRGIKLYKHLDRAVKRKKYE